MMMPLLRLPSRTERREREILSTAQRKVAQGITVDEQYADLNAARDKRKRRRERNQKLMLAGGFTQVPIINGLRNR